MGVRVKITCKNDSRTACNSRLSINIVETETMMGGLKFFAVCNSH